MMFVVLVVGSMLWGQSFAESRARDTLLNGNVSVAFTWKDVPPPDLQDQEFYLIFYNDGKYFVAKKEYPYPHFPTIFVVVDDQIRYASVKRIN